MSKKVVTNKDVIFKKTNNGNGKQAMKNKYC